jgi:OHCU decarboxylase
VATMREMAPEQKLDLIRAHPDLAGRLALAKQLTDDSTKEQGSAGLDRLSPEELARFTAINDAYRERFGFPFIMAVKGATKEQILTGFESRIGNSVETETAEALKQIERIALLRLNDRLPQ